MTERPTASQRETRATDDARPPETVVLTTRTGAANSGYAYHDIGSNNQPACGAGGSSREFETVTISEARHRNKAPC